MKKVLQYTMFYFLDMGRVAEGEIGINYPNIFFFAIALALGFIVGKLL